MGTPTPFPASWEFDPKGPWSFSLGLGRTEFESRHTATRLLFQDEWDTDTWNGSARVSYDLAEEAYVFAGVSWMDVDSNVGARDYDRVVWTVGIGVSF